MGKIGGGISDALGLRSIIDATGLTKGPSDPKSAKELEKKAAKEAEEKRLSRAAKFASSGQTRFASAPQMGMNLKKKMG